MEPINYRRVVPWDRWLHSKRPTAHQETTDYKDKRTAAKKKNARFHVVSLLGGLGR
jgi:hypothetical protein